MFFEKEEVENKNKKRVLGTEVRFEKYLDKKLSKLRELIYGNISVLKNVIGILPT